MTTSSAKQPDKEYVPVTVEITFVVDSLVAAQVPQWFKSLPTADFVARLFNMDKGHDIRIIKADKVND